MLSNKLPKVEHKTDTSPVGHVVILLIGLAIIIGLAWTHKQQQAFSRIAQSADGTVIDLELRSDTDGDTYAPKIQFLSKNGTSYIFASSYSSILPAYSIGDSVAILYHPENPQEAVIAKENFILTNPFMLGLAVLGVVFLAAGLYGIGDRMLAPYESARE